jgi:hypothetical protein
MTGARVSSPAAHEKSSRMPKISKALALPATAAGTAALRRIANQDTADPCVLLRHCHSAIETAGGQG